MNKIILDRWQGLGDNLQISTIPRRMFEKYGEKCVWISDATFYRNPEIRKLVWESNPYVAGFTDEPGESKRPFITFGKYDWIENWERIYDLSGPYSKKPEIYIQQLEDKFNANSIKVFDISYSQESLKVNQSHFPEFLETHKKLIEFLHKECNGLRIAKIINPKLTKEASVDLIKLLCPDLNFDVIEVNSIDDYCNVIFNCQEFICTHSGNHSLASALRGKMTSCIIPKRYFSMKYFTYPNVNYITI